MSIATDVSRIKGNITAALAAIADKGVSVPDGSTSDALAGLIASIEAGGGTSILTGTIGELSLLDIVRFGRWNGIPLDWYVADVDYEGYFILGLFTNQLPKLPYDNSDKTGNYDPRKWRTCVMRQFLNSTQSNDWFVPRYDGDSLPPSYSNLPGFLSEFTQEELSLIINFQSKSTEYEYGGTSYNIVTCEDLAWLPSKKMAGGSAGMAEGSRALSCTAVYEYKQCGAIAGSKTGYIYTTRTASNMKPYVYISAGSNDIYMVDTPYDNVIFVAINQTAHITKDLSKETTFWEVTV